MLGTCIKIIEQKIWKVGLGPSSKRKTRRTYTYNTYEVTYAHSLLLAGSQLGVLPGPLLRLP